MSQANTDNTTSRRGFLTKGAATVGGGAMVLATPAFAALTAAPPVDPIYAAIERHRSEQKAYGDALLAWAELHEIVPEEIRRGPRVQMGTKDGQPYYLHTHEQIDDRLEWMPDFGRTPEIRARLHDGLDRDHRELSTKQDELGMTAADERVEQLRQSCHELAWAIAETVPTSIAGVVAVLRYVNELEEGADEEGPIGNVGWHYQLGETLAAALDKGRMQS